MSNIPAKANDKYRATLRAAFIDGVDTTLAVTAIPTNLPTNITVGWNTQYETQFRVEGTSGTNSSNYALTGITKLRGYSGNLPENSAVNCLNIEEFFNQYATSVTSSEGFKALIYGEDAGSTDTYAVTISPFPADYASIKGVPLVFKANTINTGAATLNINSIGAVTIKKLHDQDLADGDIESGQLVIVTYDGTYFQMQSQIATLPTSDWTPYTTVTPTTGTFDAPSFPIVFAGVDLSTTLYPGMRVKITQATVKYFIITKVTFSTDTTVTLYGGTDYTLVASGTTAITAFSYSSVKAPAGFNIDPSKWTQTVSAAGISQVSPTANAWYNKGGGIDLPIGVWEIAFSGVMGISKGASTIVDMYGTLSTANNSESDINWRVYALHQAGSATNAVFTPFYRSGVISITAKTSYYANIMTPQTSVGTIYMSDGEDLTTKVIIRAVNAYL